jgi:hypothetical protein
MRALAHVIFVCAVTAVIGYTGAGAAQAHSHPHAVTHGVDPLPPASTRIHAAAADVAPPWCGTEQPSDNRVNQVDDGTFRYHAIYLVPADAPSRLSELAPRIQADAFGASALIERLYGRAIRFDMGTSCGTQYLDIASVRTSLTTSDFAQAAQNPDTSLGLIAHALSAAGFPLLTGGMGPRQASQLKQNFVVWLDAPAPAGCGIAQVYQDPTRQQSNWNNYGGKAAVVFRTTTGFCGADSVRHEIGHTLGALQPDAPHSFDGTHCNDAYEDTMCYPSSPVVGSGTFGAEYFDYGNNDYWDPPHGKPLGWWTANLNKFICADANCNRTGKLAVPAKQSRSPKAARHKTRAA